MHLFHGFEQPERFRGGYVAIGNFDGVHRGHQAMAQRLVERARAARVPAVVLTFDPHPINLLRPEHAPPRLSTLPHKAELLARCGVDCIIAYPTDRQLLELSPSEFFESIVRGRIAACGVVEGPNFFFGKDRAGDVNVLRQLCEAAGISLDIVPPVEVGGRIVSSSTVRRLIESGDVGGAVTLLGHPYRIRGRVVRGAERGRTLGFPTANLDGIATLLPPDGVYAGRTEIGGRVHPAAVHLGPNPTFGEQARKLEVHLLDFAGDLYGQEIDVDLRDRVRGVVKFGGIDELRAQLTQDLARVRQVADAQISK